MYENPYGRKLSSTGNPTLELNKPVAKLWPLSLLYIQDGRQPPSWILQNRKQRHSIRRPRKPQPRTKHGVDRMQRLWNNWNTGIIRL